MKSNSLKEWNSIEDLLVHILLQIQKIKKYILFIFKVEFENPMILLTDKKITNV